MVVRIRLARFGPKHAPLYNIVVAQARSARDSLPMEVLGTYDPKPKMPLSAEIAEAEAASEAPVQPKKYKDIQLDTLRTKYWLGVGAQPSDPVWRILSMVGLLQPKLGTKWRAAEGAQKIEDIRKSIA